MFHDAFFLLSGFEQRKAESEGVTSVPVLGGGGFCNFTCVWWVVAGGREGTDQAEATIHPVSPACVYLPALATTTNYV